MIAFYDGFDLKTREVPVTPSSTAEAETHANLDEKSFKIEDTGPLDPMTIYDEGTGLGHWDNDTQLDAAKENAIDDVNDNSTDLLKTHTISGIKFNLKKNNQSLTVWLTVQRDVDKDIPSYPFFVTGRDGDKLSFADKPAAESFLDAVFARIRVVMGDASSPKGEDYLKDQIYNSTTFSELSMVDDDRV